MDNVNQVYISSENSASSNMIFCGLMTIRNSRSAKITSSPVETGSLVFDGKVIMPRIVEVTGVLKLTESKSPSGGYVEDFHDFRDYNPKEVFEKLKKMFENKSYKMYAVSSKGEVIRNLVCETFEINETTDMFDAQEVTITFKELIIAKIQYDKLTATVGAGKQSNASTSNSGSSGSYAQQIMSMPNFGSRLR